MQKARISCGFTLIEVLVVIAVIGILVSVLMPSLSGARDAARTVKCLSNQRQMVTGWMMYAGDANDRAMPLAYWSIEDIGSGEQVFWWGTHGTPTTPPEYERGFLGPYLGDVLREGSVFECPEQRWGSYRPQGPSRAITSTYGYNGYYLSPAKTPGWAFSIGHRPWQRLSLLRQPTTLAVFADTLLPAVGSAMPSNNALLDPPLLFQRRGGGGGSWAPNASPTTAFRHGVVGDGGMRGGAAAAACADGHVQTFKSQPAWLTHASQGIGSIGGSSSNGPHYVPDWLAW